MKNTLFLPLIFCCLGMKVYAIATTVPVPLVKAANEFIKLERLSNIAPSPPRGGGLFILIGPHAGVSRSRYIFSERENEIADPRAITTFEGGVLLEIIPASTRGLSIETAVKFRTAGSRIIDEAQYPGIDDVIGGKTHTYWIDRKERLNFISIPALLKYTTKGSVGFQIVAGFQMNFGQKGDFVITLKDASDRTSDESGTPYILLYKAVSPDFKDADEIGFGTSRSDVYRMFNMDVVLGCGLAIPLNSNGVINMRASYTIGVSNLYNDNNLSDVRRNAALSLSVGAAFPLTK